MLFSPISPDEARSRRHRRTALCATLLVSVAALSACSSSPSKHGAVASTTIPQGTTRTTGIPKGSIPSTTTTTLPKAGAATGATCKKSQVTIAMVSRGVDKAVDVGVFAVTNTSSSRCSLTGYPQLVLSGSLGPLPVKTVDGNVAGAAQLTATLVSLAPHGGQASFATSWAYPTNGAACPDGIAVAITLPGQPTAINYATPITACNGAINVSPVQPNVIVAG